MNQFELDPEELQQKINDKNTYLPSTASILLTTTTTHQTITSITPKTNTISTAINILQLTAAIYLTYTTTTTYLNQ